MGGYFIQQRESNGLYLNVGICCNYAWNATHIAFNSLLLIFIDLARSVCIASYREQGIGCVHAPESLQSKIIEAVGDRQG